MALQVCLTFKPLFDLSYGPTSGLAESLLELSCLSGSAPDFGTLCRRKVISAASIPYRV
ncbi:transposase [Sulfitobacter sp.]|uniref:transposase n=1 Tax=Sulfitobacter sp. TaxID=1903071 RepID=UPI003FCDEEC3